MIYSLFIRLFKNYNRYHSNINIPKHLQIANIVNYLRIWLSKSFIIRLYILVFFYSWGNIFGSFYVDLLLNTFHHLIFKPSEVIDLIIILYIYQTLKIGLLSKLIDYKLRNLSLAIFKACIIPFKIFFIFKLIKKYVNLLESLIRLLGMDLWWDWSLESVYYPSL